MNALPIFIARCDPSKRCPQACRCLRFLDDSCDPSVRFVDASLTLQPTGCELFIDVRGAQLAAQFKPEVRPCP